MTRRKHTNGVRRGMPLSQPGAILSAMRIAPLLKTYRHDGPTIWALQNGREVAAGAVRQLIQQGRIIPRDPGLWTEVESQTFVLAEANPAPLDVGGES